MTDQPSLRFRLRLSNRLPQLPRTRRPLTLCRSRNRHEKRFTNSQSYRHQICKLLEVNDQSTMMEMVSLEDLGFCPPGTAWKSIYESCQNNQSCYEIDGKQVYVNTDGGLKADGNPLGRNWWSTNFRNLPSTPRRSRRTPSQRCKRLTQIWLRRWSLKALALKLTLPFLGEKTQ